MSEIPDTETLKRLLADATPGPWEAFIDDTGGQWSGWPLSISAPSITDKTVVRPGGQWPYEWDAKTSQHEAVTNARLIALAPDNAAKYEALAQRAETGEFDDYADVHVCGPTALWRELVDLGFMKFAGRVAAGEFDASAEESEVWAQSQTDPETIRVINALGIGPNRKDDH